MQTFRILGLVSSGVIAIGSLYMLRENFDPTLIDKSMLEGAPYGLSFSLGVIMATMFLNILTGNLTPDEDGDMEEGPRSWLLFIACLFLGSGAMAAAPMVADDVAIDRIAAIAGFLTLIRIIQWTMFEPQDPETTYA